MAISDRVNSWVTLIASVGVLVGLMFVGIELNQNTRQLRLQLEFEANQKIFENNRDFLGEDPTPTYAKSITNPEDLTYEEFLVASAMVFNFLNEWEERYFIYQAGLISDLDWKQRVDEDIGLTLGNRFAQAVWQSSKFFYESELVQYVDESLTDVDINESYQWWITTQAGLSTATESVQ